MGSASSHPSKKPTSQRYFIAAQGKKQLENWTTNALSLFHALGIYISGCPVGGTQLLNIRCQVPLLN
jgi:hypothetical protein